MGTEARTVPSVSLKVLGESRIDLERPVVTFTLTEGNIQVQLVTGSHWSFPFCLPRPSWVSLTCPTRRGESLEGGRGGHHTPRPSWALEAGQRLQGVHTVCEWVFVGGGEGDTHLAPRLPDPCSLPAFATGCAESCIKHPSLYLLGQTLSPGSQQPPPLLGGLAQETS